MSMNLINAIEVLEAAIDTIKSSKANITYAKMGIAAESKFIIPFREDQSISAYATEHIRSYEDIIAIQDRGFKVANKELEVAKKDLESYRSGNLTLMTTIGSLAKDKADLLKIIDGLKSNISDLEKKCEYYRSVSTKVVNIIPTGLPVVTTTYPVAINKSNIIGDIVCR